MPEPENQRPQVSKCSKYDLRSKWMGDPAYNGITRVKNLFSPSSTLA